MKKFNLSYILATRNRLPFLKITLEKLVSGLLLDEEIVVVDGESNDGSKEYLQALFDKGRIHQFVSEPDKNQAHAWNKAMLMARGTIIKKIIDDDVFCYKAIRECKNHMLLNPEVDVVISNDLGVSLEHYKNINRQGRLAQFEEWKNGTKPSFTFSDVHMLVRRSSLAFIGLYNTGFVMMDWEYSLRISYLKANIAYYTGFNALNVAHPQTVTASRDIKLIEEQGKRGCVFYEYPGDASEISLWSKIKIMGGKLVKPVSKHAGQLNYGPVEDMAAKYDYLYNYIAEVNNAQPFMFLKKN